VRRRLEGSAPFSAEGKRLDQQGQGIAAWELDSALQIADRSPGYPGPLGQPLLRQIGLMAQAAQEEREEAGVLRLHACCPLSRVATNR